MDMGGRPNLDTRANSILPRAIRKNIMAGKLYPDLKPFVLSNVQLTGTTIGAGSYGSVEVVAVEAAAKKIHEHIKDHSRDHRRASTRLVKECELMSTLRHPNIVQFLGVCFFPDSRLPALVMERLLMSLHNLLAPDSQLSPDAQNPPDSPSYFSLDLKCSVLHNVASGLAYLHGQQPPIIHRDLSAKNVLLDAGLVAKIADLGVARIMEAATSDMTVAPGSIMYMPPEAMEGLPYNDQKSKYDASIDIFSLGIVIMFTIGEMFPSHPNAASYTDEASGSLVARNEVERRSRYMEEVNDKLDSRRGDHPLIRLIHQCLHNIPAKRPGIRKVLHLLEEARASVRKSDDNKQKLLAALNTKQRNPVRIYTCTCSISLKKKFFSPRICCLLVIL